MCGHRGRRGSAPFHFRLQSEASVSQVGQKISFDLREQFFESLLQQGPNFFGRIGVGDLMTRDSGYFTDSATHRVWADSGRHHDLRAALWYDRDDDEVGHLDVADPAASTHLVYLCAVCCPADGESSRIVQETLAALGSHTQENLSGIRTVQAGAQEANEIARFFKTNDRYASAFYEQSRINSLMTAWTPWLTACAQLVLMYGGNLVLEGELSVGDLIFFACLNMLLQPIRMAGFFITMLARAGVAVDRLAEVFDAPPEIQRAEWEGSFSN